jgi:diguanylate cyclase (GGDEF)-like protein
MINFAFLPDLSALAILVVILLLVRRRHPGARVNAWLLGLFVTLVESVAHTFYPANGIPAAYLHVIVVDGYLVAGMIFIWGAGNPSISRESRSLYLALNGLPLLALITTYGLNLRTSPVYTPAIVIGLVCGIVTSFLLRRNWSYAALYAVGWIAIGVLVQRGMFREAIYWSLACVYLIAAINFERRLEGNTTGKLAIVPGLAIWSICFLLHPWVVDHAAYTDIASHVLNLQNSLVAIGMILVLLEEQVSTNKWLALHDELTGLPNRRMFAATLDLAIERATRDKSTLALVVLDLDGLKSINDSLGHHAGDQVLREISSTLRKSVRTADTVARLGGDEFIIMAADMNNEKTVQRFVESVARAIERPIVFGGQPILVTASLGIAIFPDDAEDAIALLRLADQRMYSLKKRPLLQPKIETSGMTAISPPA